MLENSFGWLPSVHGSKISWQILRLRKLSHYMWQLKRTFLHTCLPHIIYSIKQSSQNLYLNASSTESRYVHKKNSSKKAKKEYCINIALWGNKFADNNFPISILNNAEKWCKKSFGIRAEECFGHGARGWVVICTC